MSMCGSCALKVDRFNAKINCIDCGLIFHSACVNLKDADVEFLKNNKTDWRCKKCLTVRRGEGRGCSLNNSEVEPSASSKITLDDIHRELINIKKTSSSSAHTIEDLVKRISSLEHTFQQALLENKNLKKRVCELEERLDALQYRSHTNYLNFVNVPKVDDIDDTQAVLKIINTGLGVSADINDIDHCSRKQIKKNDKVLDIVTVKFVKTNTAKKIINSKSKLNKENRLKQSLNTSLITNGNNKPIYVNEWMSSHKRKLLAGVREIQKSKHYKYLWYRNGTIMLRKDSSSETIFIKTAADLHKHFPA